MALPTIVTRTGKGSALTFAEGDANFTNLQTATLTVTDGTNSTALNLNDTLTLSAGTNMTVTESGGTVTFDATGTGGIAEVVDDTTPQLGGSLDVNGNSIVSTSAGNIAITPDTTGLVVLDGLNWPPVDGSSGQVLYTNGAANLAWKTVTEATGNELENVVEDLTPQLGGNLDVQTNSITTSTTNGNLTLEANGTGSLVINAGTGINLKAASNIFTDTASTDIDISSTGYINLNNLTYFGSGIEETVYASTTTTGTYAPSATNGSIHYVAMTGSMTINGFNNVTAGQTISLFFDGTGGAYTLTLGASILSPGGSLALTSGGYDIVTITCVDDVTPVYIATAVNNFQ